MPKRHKASSLRVDNNWSQRQLLVNQFAANPNGATPAESKNAAIMGGRDPLNQDYVALTHSLCLDGPTSSLAQDR